MSRPIPAETLCLLTFASAFDLPLMLNELLLCWLCNTAAPTLISAPLSTVTTFAALTLLPNTLISWSARTIKLASEFKLEPVAV